MNNGYAFEWSGAAGQWKRSHGEGWDIVMFTGATGKELVMRKSFIIDGSACRVFTCQDGEIRAQTLVSLGITA